MRLALCNAAWYRVERSLLEEGAPADPVRIPTTWAVIQHPDGLVLVDTGVHPASCVAAGDPRADGRPTAGHSCDAHSALRGLGLFPSAVAVVVNTHLHVDHVGQNRRFPQARFLTRQAELEYARNPTEPRLAGEYPADQIALEALDYQPIEGGGDVDLFSDGTVTLLSTPGHSAGHQSVLVRFPVSRPILLAGDAVWTAACRDDPSAFPSVLWSRPAYAASRLRLLELAAHEDARWCFTHEPTNFGPDGWHEGRWLG